VAPAAANLVEIFSSFQGEGPYVGGSTLFVRFGACDLRCRWCDSPHTWMPAARCRIAGAGGDVREIDNPVPVSEVVAIAGELDLARHRFVSLTGGEPLLQPEAVAALARELRGEGRRVLLETHGLAEAGLARVIDAIDVVSMDWKLASEVRRADAAHGGSEPFHAAHAAFLRVARRAPEVYVKVVVTPATTDVELDELASHLAGVDPAIPLVLQPVTPHGPVRQSPTPERLLAWQARLERSLRDVRVIPQTHKSLGVP